MPDSTSRTESLYHQKFDFPAATVPRHFFIVLSAARAGSTLFCNELWRTGALGAPAEYFNFRFVMFQLSARLGVTRLDDYVARLFAIRTSPNGVFGVKALWEQFQFMMLSGVIQHFAGAKWIRIGRRDSVAQAISFVKARQTSQWDTLHEKRDEPEYDFDRIASARRVLIGLEAERDAFFKRSGIRPLHLFYEDLTADLPEAVRAAQDFLSFPAAPAHAISVPRIERQSDETSAQWRERFEAEAAERGLSLSPSA